MKHETVIYAWSEVLVESIYFSTSSFLNMQQHRFKSAVDCQLWWFVFTLHAQYLCVFIYVRDPVLYTGAAVLLDLTAVNYDMSKASQTFFILCS